MSEELGPIEPRKWRFPAPPVCTALWEQADWDLWAQWEGSLEPLVISTAFGDAHAVGRNAKGDLLYRINTSGDV